MQETCTPFVEGYATGHHEPYIAFVRVLVRKDKTKGILSYGRKTEHVERYLEFAPVG